MNVFKITAFYVYIFLSLTATVFSDQFPNQNEFNEDKLTLLKQLTLIAVEQELYSPIKNGDSLKITFRDRNHINEGVYVVSPQGQISLPLSGVCQVFGLNRKDARNEIENQLEMIIRYPEVKLTKNTENKFLLLGAVNEPGMYEIKQNLNLTETVLANGDFDQRYANLKSIIHIRGTFQNPEVARLDLKKFIQRGDRSDNIPVKSGDLIYVPKEFVIDVDGFKKMFMNLMANFDKSPQNAIF